jgi:RNA polymerase-binding protein DksA
MRASPDSREQKMTSIDDYEKKLLQLRADYMRRREAIHKDTHHQDEPVEKDFAEQVSQRETEDVLGALEEEAKQVVMQIDNALLRIKSGEYGICACCGEEIPAARLDAIPYAQYCVDCAEDLSR